jgi:hypothetical protein
MAEDKTTKRDRPEGEARNQPDLPEPQPESFEGTGNPEETVAGQSFYNPALTGSGTIQDGTYTDPLPDPTQRRGLGPDRTSGGRLILRDPERVTPDDSDSDENRPGRRSSSTSGSGSSAGGRRAGGSSGN